MKKLKQLAKKTSANKLFPLMTLIVGLTIGIGAGFAIWGQSTQPTTLSESSSTETSKKRSEGWQQRARSAYKRTLDQIESDKESKKLTEEQSKKVEEKVNEIYEYLKTIDRSTASGMEAYREKQKEWRQWAEENNVSRTYLLRL